MKAETSLHVAARPIAGAIPAAFQNKLRGGTARFRDFTSTLLEARVRRISIDTVCVATRVPTPERQAHKGMLATSRLDGNHSDDASLACFAHGQYRINSPWYVLPSLIVWARW